MVAHLFSWSDAAWEGLTSQAAKQNFTQTAFRARGLGNYLVALVRTNPNPEEWEDTRPQGIKEFELEELEDGRLSLWDNLPSKRYPHELGGFPAGWLSSVERLADYWGTVRQVGPGTRGRFTRTAKASQFFEAVGLGWLTPQVFPTDKARYHRKDKELIW